MGLRTMLLEWLLAGRSKNEPDRRTDVYPFPFGNFMSSKGNQPTMKRTPANLRLLSESPIPRRAINVIKDGITQLKWSVVAINEQDQEKYKDICNIIVNTLKKPNPSDSFRLLLEQTVEDMLVASAGAVEIAAAGDPSRPLRLFPVDAFSVELFPEWDGKRDSNRYAQKDQGKYIYLTDADLMYIRMNPRSNTPFGLSPMETVWESVNFFINSHKFAGRQAGNSVTKKLLNLGKTADSNAVSAFRAYWANEIQGRGMMPIVSGDGVSTVELGATGDEMLFLQWQRFLIEVVALAFGVSPKKLGQTKDVNRATAETEDEDTKETIQSIAENIAEHINSEIVEARFKMGSVIQFKFEYAASLREKKLKADTDAIYLERGVLTVDEVRDSIGKKPHQNQNGEVILFPSATRSIDVNKPLESQSLNNPPLDKPITARRIQASEDQQDDTDKEEQEFILAYLAIMLAVMRRGKNTVSIDSMVAGWMPTLNDYQTLTDSIYNLRSIAWLTSYNRRRLETGGTQLLGVPDEVAAQIKQESDTVATQVMDTYKTELKSRMNTAKQQSIDLPMDEMKKSVQADMINWLTQRMSYKADEISANEAGKSWNDGLFAHDKEFAPDTQYIVMPESTEHEACAEIIAGAPYMRDEIPADLPLHPNCPHRYYAVVAK